MTQFFGFGFIYPTPNGTVPSTESNVNLGLSRRAPSPRNLYHLLARRAIPVLLAPEAEVDAIHQAVFSARRSSKATRPPSSIEPLDRNDPIRAPKLRVLWLASAGSGGRFSGAHEPRGAAFVSTGLWGCLLKFRRVQVSLPRGALRCFGAEKRKEQHTAPSEQPKQGSQVFRELRLILRPS